jgi:hypothetical protein
VVSALASSDLAAEMWFSFTYEVDACVVEYMVFTMRDDKKFTNLTLNRKVLTSMIFYWDTITKNSLRSVIHVAQVYREITFEKIV